MNIQSWLLIVHINSAQPFRGRPTTSPPMHNLALFPLPTGGQGHALEDSPGAAKWTALPHSNSYSRTDAAKREGLEHITEDLRALASASNQASEASLLYRAVLYLLLSCLLSKRTY